MSFQSYYENVANPFEWKFTKTDLRRLFAKLDEPVIEQRIAA